MIPPLTEVRVFGPAAPAEITIEPAPTDFAFGPALVAPLPAVGDVVRVGAEWFRITAGGLEGLN